MTRKIPDKQITPSIRQFLEETYPMKRLFDSPNTYGPTGLYQLIALRSIESELKTIRQHLLNGDKEKGAENEPQKN